MANVSIKFNNKEFLLSCEDGQEEHLEELLIQINQKFNNLKNDLGNLGENKLLLITAVKVMDEYYETKKKVDQKKDELRDLSTKFKELKSLIFPMIFNSIFSSSIIAFSHWVLLQSLPHSVANAGKQPDKNHKKENITIRRTIIVPRYHNLINF